MSITAKVPAAPGALRASVASGSGVTLSWSDNSDNETTVIIERYDDSQKKFATIGTVGANTTTFTDSTAVQGKHVYLQGLCI